MSPGFELLSADSAISLTGTWRLRLLMMNVAGFAIDACGHGGSTLKQRRVMIDVLRSPGHHVFLVNQTPWYQITRSAIVWRQLVALITK